MSKFPKANKDLGQHFLVNQKVIQQITMDFKDEAQAMIEIGPGPAVLTQHLAKHDLPYTIIEMDRRFEKYLLEHLSEEQLVFADALDVDLNQLIKDKFGDKEVWMVSNLPYNVSSPLIVRFLQCPQIKYMTLMMQKEVGQKILPPANEKNPAGSLMSLCQNYFKVSNLCKVPPGSFQPPPKVDSLVLSFERIESPEISINDFKSYESFLRKMFAQKRKQMVKVLSQHYPKDQIIKALEELEKPLTIRSESLNLQDAQFLFKRLDQNQ